MSAETGIARPWRTASDGVRVAVRLTPRGGRDRVDGPVAASDGLRLGVRVSAPPVDGAANEALIALLAKAWKVRRSDLDVVAGASAREKLVRLSGPVDEVLRDLETWWTGEGWSGG